MAWPQSVELLFFFQQTKESVFRKTLFVLKNFGIYEQVILIILDPFPFILYCVNIIFLVYLNERSSLRGSTKIRLCRYSTQVLIFLLFSIRFSTLSLCRKIFIGGLSYSTDEEKLRKYFRAYGTVQDAVVMKDPISKRSRGFGFITFYEISSVDHVLANEPHTIDARKVIEVNSSYQS